MVCLFIKRPRSGYARPAAKCMYSRTMDLTTTAGSVAATCGQARRQPCIALNFKCCARACATNALGSAQIHREYVVFDGFPLFSTGFRIYVLRLLVLCTNNYFKRRLEIRLFVFQIRLASGAHSRKCGVSKLPHIAPKPVQKDGAPLCLSETASARVPLVLQVLE